MAREAAATCFCSPSMAAFAVASDTPTSIACTHGPAASQSLQSMGSTNPYIVHSSCVVGRVEEVTRCVESSVESLPWTTGAAAAAWCDAPAPRLWCGPASPRRRPCAACAAPPAPWPRLPLTPPATRRERWPRQHLGDRPLPAGPRQSRRGGSRLEASRSWLTIAVPSPGLHLPQSPPPGPGTAWMRTPGAKTQAQSAQGGGGEGLTVGTRCIVCRDTHRQQLRDEALSRSI